MSCFKACFGGGGSSPRDQKERGSRYVVGGESQGGPSLATAADAAATSGLNGNGAASLATAAEAGGLGQAKEREQGAAASSGANVGSSAAVSSAANGVGSGGGEGGKGGGGKIVASVGFTGPESTQRPISTISPLTKANSISSDGNSSNNAEFQALTTPKSIFHTTAQNHVVDQEATRPPRAAGGGKENLVKDSDSACVPGAKVFVSEQWLQVPYFSQFRGLTGVLTRRGVNGVTWYATFPGLLEQAFSTGMHGQHVLAYATESEHPSQPIVAAERMQEDAHAPPRNQPQQQQQQQASPPKPRASLPPLAAVGAVVPPPSAFVAQQPFAAHPPKPTAQDIHGMGSARKDRPSTARSRQLMGAPPLGSGRSQMSARGGKNLGLQIGATPRDGSMTGRENKIGRLYKYPEWEEYELFDSDDLWSEHIYLLYGESAPGGNVVYVWIGQYVEGVDYKSDSACDAFARKAVSEFKAAMGGWPVGQINFARELKEPEAFWDYFCWG